MQQEDFFQLIRTYYLTKNSNNLSYIDLTCDHHNYSYLTDEETRHVLLSGDSFQSAAIKMVSTNQLANKVAKCNGLSKCSVRSMNSKSHLRVDTVSSVLYR